MPTAAPPYPQQRRSSRLLFRCQIQIKGKDAEGNAFSDDAVTLSIGKFGASLSTSRQYHLGQIVTVLSKQPGHVGQFQVVWIGKPGTREAGQIGIEMLDARRFWGIEFPPEDWGMRQI